MRVPPLALPVLLVLTAAPLPAQVKDPSRRPELPAGADTNDAHVYYQFGIAKLQRDPRAAADAFYWAARINPGWAEALYARGVALMASDDRRLQRYYRGDRGTLKSKEIRQIDSLYARAFMQNPFLPQSFDKFILDTWVRSIAEDAERSSGATAGEIEHEIQTYIQRNASPAMRARLAYGWGNYREALDHYATAIKNAKYKASLRTDRGRLFFQIGEVDSALVELQQALEERRKSDEKDVVFFYEPKAFLEHAIAVIHERRDEMDEAREAYGRALTEDLSYYPAHLNLGFLALTLHDTATAINELQLATQIRGNEPMLRYLLGNVLAVSMKLPEAETELKKAAELEPLFALPHYMLGQVYEQQMRLPDALQAYRRFLSLSARSDLRRADAEKRAAELEPTVRAGGVKP